MALPRVLFGLLALAVVAVSLPGNDRERVHPLIQERDDPILPGTACNCVQYHDVVDGDNCWSITQKYPPLSTDSFYAYNPAVHKNCDNLEKGYRVCVQISGPTPSFCSAAASTTVPPTATPSTTSSGSAANTATPDPLLPGEPCNCREYHDIKAGDSCSGIIQEYPPLTSDQFFSYNPYIHTNCSNLLVGFRVCVAIDGTTPSACTTTSSAAVTTSVSLTPGTWSAIGATSTSTYTPANITTPTATSGPPSPTQSGVDSFCNRWHRVGPIDTCQNIVARYSTWIDYAEFIEMNPVVGTNCTGLLLNYYVCVGHPLAFNTTSVSQWFPSWTPPVGITVTPVLTPSPIQSGIVSGCVGFYEAASGDSCDSIASMYYISPSQLEQWNPALGNNCSGLIVGDNYCVDNGNITHTVPFVTTAPSPTQSGISQQCTAWYKAMPGDDCDTIPFTFGTFNTSDFISWNPSVGQNCSSLIVGDYYCIAIPGIASTRTSSISFVSATPTGNSTGPPGPIQSGAISNCTSWWYVGTTDTCASIAQYAGISEAQLISWNPALNSGCSNLQPNFFICVSDGALTPGTITTGPATPKGSSTSMRSSMNVTSSAVSRRNVPNLVAKTSGG